MGEVVVEPSRLSGLFPEGVVCAEFVGADRPSFVDEKEAAALGDAVEKRALEYLRGRACARAALERLGITGFSLLRGESREPLWPEGVVGAITHCEGYAAAAVCRGSSLAGVGLDAEAVRPLDAAVLKRIARPEERESLALLDPAVRWDLVLFSAKESVFKAWFPRTRVWLGFQEARIEFDAVRCRFSATVMPKEGEGAVYQGRFVVEAERVITSAF
jgi:4'-phosphopantetheinyl transferase EntD